MNASPERNISRLLCPRRLKPRTDYVACVVPATDGGRLRGLGQPVAMATLGPAWSLQAPNDIELPVYFSWTFSTGPVGDIETLARRLRTPAQYGGDATLLAQLHHIGERPVYVDGDHLLFDGPTPGQTVFEGAMVSLGVHAGGEQRDVYAGKLAEILNSGSTSVATGTAPAKHVPTLSPPIYGEFPAKRHTVDTTKVASHWLDGLSLQPRYRLAAGWGAEVVRQNQDEFMQAAWEQFGDVLAAERAFSLARLARDVLKRIEVRHLAKLSPDRVLAVMSPARARIAVAAGESLYGRMANATLPQELFDGSMRRFASPRRATLKMARWRERNLALPIGHRADGRAGRQLRQRVEATHGHRPEPLRARRHPRQPLLRQGAAAREPRHAGRPDALHRPRVVDDRHRDQGDPGRQCRGAQARVRHEEEGAADGRRVAPRPADRDARDPRRPVAERHQCATFRRPRAPDPAQQQARDGGRAAVGRSKAS